MVAVSLKKFFFQAEDGIRDDLVTGVQTCALPILELLPVLRRTFSEFTSAERRKLGEKARRTDSTGTSSAVGASVTENECLNREEAKKVIPVIRQLLGLETK